MLIDKDAERRLLLSLLHYQDFIPNVNKDLFTGEEQNVFLAIVSAYASYGEVTREGIRNFYGQEPPTYIDLPSTRRPESIIDYLESLRVKRALVDIRNKIDVLVQQNSISLEDINKILSFDDYAARSTALDDGIIEFTSELNQKLSKKYNFLSTGIDFLDYMLGGEWPRRGLTVILGEGGSGKTALVTDSILRMAIKGTPTLFFSLEMVKSRLIQRLVANYANINSLNIRTGNLTEEEVEKINQSVAYIQKLPIYICDDPNLSIDQIVTLTRQHYKRCGIRAVFVDYLQIIGGMLPVENVSDLYGYYATSLRNVAIECDIAAILLAQQNRSLRGLHSIFGSGRVGHAADVVFELNTIDKKELVRPVEIVVHKNRDGPLGSYTVAYNSPYMRFSNK